MAEFKDRLLQMRSIKILPPSFPYSHFQPVNCIRFLGIIKKSYFIKIFLCSVPAAVECTVFQRLLSGAHGTV